jgi:AcrR family transcriptional regulator
MRKRDENKQQLIFQATLKLIMAHGFHATPMSLIAKEAGVAAGTIYLYFKSKEILLNQLYLNEKHKYSKAVLTGFPNDLAIRSSFELMWNNSLDYQIKNTDSFRFIEQFKISPFLEKVTAEEGQLFFKSANKLIKRAKTEAVIKDIPNNLIVTLFFAPISELVKQNLHYKTKISKTVRELTVQGCWDAIKI